MNAKIPLALTIGALTLALAACSNDRGSETPAAAEANAATAGQNDSGATDGYGMNSGAADADSNLGMTDASPGDATNDPTTMGMSSADHDQNPGLTTQATALQMVMDVDQHEIAAAEQAEGKKLDPDVKAYADTLKKDHTKNLAATRSLMTDAGDSASTPGASTDSGASNSELAAMRSKHESERKQLASLDGDAYQTAWLDAMVKGHTEALGKLDSELIPAASDAKVKQHLTDTRSVIAAHLETAKELRSAQ